MSALVAHRGYAAKFPENSMPALRGALRAGARWLECDVQLAADRVPVLLHDATLKRTAGDKRKVFDLEATELAEVSVHEPDRFGHAHMPTPVPGLDAVVELVGRVKGATLFVELKQESIDRFGAEVVVGQVIEACEAAPDQCVIISFDDRAVQRARKRGGFRIGWVIGAWNNEVRSVAAELAPDFLFADIAIVPPSGPLWPGPWRWACYDAKDADTAIRMSERGFALVETKAVGELFADPRIAAWPRG
jgi:glycerophosphoryl diester phosphodiesterase